MTGKCLIGRTVLVLLCALAALCCLPPAGEQPALAEDLAELIFADETEPADAEKLGVSPDARLPVYWAPFEDARRPDGGQGSVSVSDGFDVLAKAGDWRMIEYAGGSCRTGWIFVPDARRDDELEYNDFPRDARLLRLTRGADLTDEPWGTRRTAAHLQEGEIVTGLASFDLMDREPYGTYLYVQAETDGQTAWLFIDPDAVEEVPMVRREGDTLYILDGVTRIGYISLRWLTEEPGEPAWEFPMPIRRTDVALSGIGLYDDEDDDEWNFAGIRRIVLPDSLRVLGGEAFAGGSLDELRLPKHLEAVSYWAFDWVTIEKLIIPREYTGVIGEAAFDFCGIRAIEVEEGNPLYSSRDGVLYSADGTKLLMYPDGKKDLHFDVPAGVTEIAPYAFASDGMDNPLQTITLPVGLLKIGPRAFCGCGRLLSLTVPLTVTEISDEAFFGCASLERLSLPPGLTVPMEGNGIMSGDFTWYNGDNGETLPGPKPDVWDWEDE